MFKNITRIFICIIILYSEFSNAQIFEANLEIKNHKFDPEEVIVPAGKRIRLKVKNLDSTAEEFESIKLKREKIIPANSEITVSFGPLKEGEYDIFGDFHKSAKGVVIAKEMLSEN